MEKLTDLICRIWGHKDFMTPWSYALETGIVAICRRCGKGFKNMGWNIDDAYNHYKHWLGL